MTTRPERRPNQEATTDTSSVLVLKIPGVTRTVDSPVALMATKNAFVLRAFITGIVCIVMVGLGWLSDPLTAGDQTGAISRLVAWFSLAAAAIALIIAIYFTCRALTIREPQKNLI